MSAPDPAPSRRQFLVGGALLGSAGAALGAGALRDSSAHGGGDHNGGDHTMHGGGSGAMHGGGINGPTFRAGATVDHAANGFHPSKVLRDFDYGRVSRTSDGRTLRQWDVFAADKEIEVAPGVRFPAWTFNSRIPGPTLRCREGDLLRVRFVNDSAHPHTMHFHGIHPAEMDGIPMVGRGVIAPGRASPTPSRPSRSACTSTTATSGHLPNTSPVACTAPSSSTRGRGGHPPTSW